MTVNNGARFETYIIEGARAPGTAPATRHCPPPARPPPAGAPGPPGTIPLNGAAARLGVAGDHVIVISYAEYDEGELADFAPKIVSVDAPNRIAPPKSRGRNAVV